MRFGPLLTAILLSGCAQPMIWDKPGGTQAEFNQDNYSCERDTRQSGYYGSGLVGALNMREFFKHCMIAHGYTLRAQSSSAPSYPVTAVNDEREMITDEECLRRFGVKCPPYLQRH